MNANILKSIGSVLAGLIFIFITHTGTDAILENTGILPKGHLFVGAGLIVLVIGYRALLSLLGCYITAMLAPQKPMKHAIILGIIGLVLSTIGAIANMKMKLGPDWYAWTLVVISVPIAWFAGRLYETKASKGK